MQCLSLKLLKGIPCILQYKRDMTVEIATPNDEVVSVRLVRGKPVADLDALGKYLREYYRAGKQARVRARALQVQVLQPECLGKAPPQQPGVCPAPFESRAGHASERAGCICFRQLRKCRHPFLSPLVQGWQSQASASTSLTGSTPLRFATHTVAKKGRMIASPPQAPPRSATLAASIIFQI